MEMAMRLGIPLLVNLNNIIVEDSAASQLDLHKHKEEQ